MYSESDLESAVSAGVIPAEAASALRQHVAQLRVTPLVDEENFRLLTGFNDIFVAIAGVLLLVGAAWIGNEFHPALGGAAVAALSWGLSEYFTRIRRMALPSIIFLLAFVGGVIFTCVGLFFGKDNVNAISESAAALIIALSGAAGVAAAYAHWRRFHVPITIAAGVAALAGGLLSLLAAMVPEFEPMLNFFLLVIGIVIFGLAMFWDGQDPARTTGKSDVAFWLHLLAAPLIAHPIFMSLGLLDGNASMGTALVVVTLYVAMGIIALAIDRRALLVSALAYVTSAIISLFQQFGALSLNVALAIFVIGSALLLLSAFWQNARRAVFSVLPEAIQRHLPVVLPAPTLQPAS